MKNKNRICYIYLPFTNAKVMQHNVCYKNRTAEYKSIGFKLILIKHVANTLVNVNSSGLEWWFIVSLYYFSKEKMRLIADLLFYLCVWQAAICSEKKKRVFLLIPERFEAGPSCHSLGLQIIQVIKCCSDQIILFFQIHKMTHIFFS